ncbi:hypothetical protein AAID93_01605 [Campylobacter coli]|nr:hypothetical protein BOP99_09340 [Campylobacter coli]OOX91990.1 hypothetical protein BOP99_09245 [Campylobacter coli]HEB9350198.1 hypothetical protein [Campylobacter coli]
MIKSNSNKKILKNVYLANAELRKKASYERKMAKLEIEKILAKKSTQAFLVYVLEDKVEIIEI